MDNTSQHLLPGDLLIGFCGGAFGRDSFFDKTVEAVGDDWVVARTVDGEPEFASGENIHSELWEHCERDKRPPSLLSGGREMSPTMRTMKDHLAYLQSLEDALTGRDGQGRGFLLMQNIGTKAEELVWVRRAIAGQKLAIAKLKLEDSR